MVCGQALLCYVSCCAVVLCMYRAGARKVLAHAQIIARVCTVYDGYGAGPLTDFDSLPCRAKPQAPTLAPAVR
jgi:hypothetical protein